MAPLTRNRAGSDGTPKDIAREYYAQRAPAGLIITAATQISAMGKGYLETPAARCFLVDRTTLSFQVLELVLHLTPLICIFRRVLHFGDYRPFPG